MAAADDADDAAVIWSDFATRLDRVLLDETGAHAVAWKEAIATDARGRATTTVKLPESLTTYRVMAVAADRASRFGSGDSEVRINKPVVLKAAFPRFLTRGDRAHFGSVVTSQISRPGSAIVTMRSLDPTVLRIVGETRRVVQVDAVLAGFGQRDRLGERFGRRPAFTDG